MRGIQSHSDCNYRLTMLTYINESMTLSKLQSGLNVSNVANGNAFA